MRVLMVFLPHETDCPTRGVSLSLEGIRAMLAWKSFRSHTIDFFLLTGSDSGLEHWRARGERVSMEAAFFTLSGLFLYAGTRCCCNEGKSESEGLLLEEQLLLVLCAY